MNCPLWRDYKAGRTNRSQRFVLAGNLKYLECKELPVFDEVLKYSKKPWEWKKWFEEEDVKAVPILNGETLVEYFGNKLF